MATTGAARKTALEKDTEELMRSIRELAPQPARRAPSTSPTKRAGARAREVVPKGARQ